MIQGINFMGREEYLTKPVKEVAKKAPEYFRRDAVTGVGTISTSKEVAETERKIAEAVRAKNAPYIATHDTSKEAQTAREWALAHGQPIE